MARAVVCACVRVCVCVRTSVFIRERSSSTHEVVYIVNGTRYILSSPPALRTPRPMNEYTWW